MLSLKVLVPASLSKKLVEVKKPSRVPLLWRNVFAYLTRMLRSQVMFEQLKFSPLQSWFLCLGLGAAPGVGTGVKV